MKLASSGTAIAAVLTPAALPAFVHDNAYLDQGSRIVVSITSSGAAPEPAQARH